MPIASFFRKRTLLFRDAPIRMGELLETHGVRQVHGLSAHTIIWIVGG